MLGCVQYSFALLLAKQQENQTIQIKNDLPALSADEDSMLLNTVRIRIVKSKDSLYHTNLVKLSRGNTPLQAEQTATQINFPIKQNDSILYLPKGFGISKESKFRNQQVLVVIEVPVGKAIRIDHSIDWYAWFNINSSRRGLNIDIDDNYFNYNDYSWRNDIWYVMTDKGLERLDKKDTSVNIKLRTELLPRKAKMKINQMRSLQRK